MTIRLRGHLRRMLVASGLLLALLVMAAPAQAGGPTITPIGGQRSFLLPRNPCPFPVWADSSGHGIDIALIRNGGIEMYVTNVTGTVTYTNLDNQKSVTLHLVSSIHEEDYPDGSAHIRMVGPNTYWTYPEPLTQLTLLSGQFDRYYDADGNLTSWTVNGSLTNLCDLLAG